MRIMTGHRHFWRRAVTSLLFALSTFGLFVALGHKLTPETIFTSVRSRLKSADLAGMYTTLCSSDSRAKWNVGLVQLALSNVLIAPLNR